MKKENNNKKATRILLFFGVGMLLLLLLVRLIATNVNPQTGLAEVNIPTEDVNLPKKENKIEQFEREQKKEEEEKYIQKENPLEIKNNFQTAVGQENKQADVQTENNNGQSNYYNDEQSDRKKNEVELNQENEINAKENYSNTVTENNEKKIADHDLKKQSVFGTIYTRGTNKVTEKKINPKDVYKAVIHSDQSIGNGMGVICRNTEDILLPDGILLPKNSILYGKAAYSADRVIIELTRAITGNKEEYAIDLLVYDNDYIEGIYFKSPVDDGVDKTKGDLGDEIINNSGSNTAVKLGGKLIKNVVKNTADVVKNNRKLKVEEGYIIYLKPGAKYKL